MVMDIVEIAHMKESGPAANESLEVASKPSAASPSGQAAAAATASAPIGVTPDRLATVLQSVGYRANVVETNGIFEVRSASQGLSFFARFGNRTTVDRQFYDFTFFCPLAITGDLNTGVLELWNRSRRFARLQREQHLLILAMDVLAAGGVPDTYLRAQCELWDSMIRDLILHLRQSGQQPPAVTSTDGSTPAAGREPPKVAH